MHGWCWLTALSWYQFLVHRLTLCFLRLALMVTLGKLTHTSEKAVFCFHSQTNQRQRLEKESLVFSDVDFQLLIAWPFEVETFYFFHHWYLWGCLAPCSSALTGVSSSSPSFSTTAVEKKCGNRYWKHSSLVRKVIEERLFRMDNDFFYARPSSLQQVLLRHAISLSQLRTDMFFVQFPECMKPLHADSRLDSIVCCALWTPADSQDISFLHFAEEPSRFSAGRSMNLQRLLCFFFNLG